MIHFLLGFISFQRKFQSTTGCTLTPNLSLKGVGPVMVNTQLLDHSKHRHCCYHPCLVQVITSLCIGSSHELLRSIVSSEVFFWTQGTIFNLDGICFFLKKILLNLQREPEKKKYYKDMLLNMGKGKPCLCNVLKHLAIHENSNWVLITFIKV